MYDNNPFYNPESLDLEEVGVIDDPAADYSFDYLVVWKHKDGDLYWASDSGCSCPSPFEDYNSLDQLEHVKKGDQFSDEVKNLVQAIREHCAPYEYDRSGEPGTWHPIYDFENDTQGPEKTALIKKVIDLVK